MSLHIHAPQGTVFRVVMRCRSCRARRRMVVERFAWYDPNIICCACGWKAIGGEVRRQSPRQRAQSAAKAKRMWAEAQSRFEAEQQLHELVVGL